MARESASALLALLSVTSRAAECQDANSGCGAWAKSGECSNNPQYMRQHCAAACGFCMPETTTPSAATSFRFDAIIETLRTMHEWTPGRLASLRSALDPDGDGLVDNDDWKMLVGETCWQPSPSQMTPNPFPQPPSTPPSGGGSLSTRVADVTPAFVLGRSPPKQAESRYYFRAEVGTALDAQSQDVFERCAARCLQLDECWLFSTSTAHRSCSIHTKMWGFTSFSV